jgi:hypothetical protein
MPHRRTYSRDPFEVIRTIGLTLPGVEAAVRYDGTPLLRLGGAFVASLASHPSADPRTLVVRCEFEQRECLLEDAPDTYYVTEYYAKYPLVLARLDRLNDDALRDLLTVSCRLTASKARPRRRTPTRRRS